MSKINNSKAWNLFCKRNKVTYIFNLFCNRSISSTVTIFVSDTNNQCPQFTKDAYFGEISASDVYALEVGTLKQLLLVANDNDTVSINLSI